MANHKSAVKAHASSLKRRDINRRNRSTLRTALKQIRTAATAGDAETARKLLPGTLSLIAKSVKRGVIHGNAGARHKSRVSRLVNRSAAK
jgi:small subunit ribosomal protein S20